MSLIVNPPASAASHQSDAPPTTAALPFVLARVLLGRVLTWDWDPSRPATIQPFTQTLVRAPGPWKAQKEEGAPVRRSKQRKFDRGTRNMHETINSV